MSTFYGPTINTPGAATPINGVSTGERLYGNFTLVAMVANLTGTAPMSVQLQSGPSNTGPWTNVGNPVSFPANNSAMIGKVEGRVYASFLRAVVTNANGDHVAMHAFFVEGPVTWST